MERGEGTVERKKQKRTENGRRYFEANAATTGKARRNRDRQGLIGRGRVERPGEAHGWVALRDLESARTADGGRHDLPLPSQRGDGSALASIRAAAAMDHGRTGPGGANPKPPEPRTLAARPLALAPANQRPRPDARNLACLSGPGARCRPLRAVPGCQPGRTWTGALLDEPARCVVRRKTGTGS
ncbi:hypothetical protein VTN02DRAFT_3457 [Thermoascus thermophilus]